MARCAVMASLLSGLIAASVGGQKAFAEQKVIIEPRPVFVPAGKGMKPFDVTRHSVPLVQIEAGGPPRDGIPALINPQFLAAGDVKKLLRDSDRVVGVHLNGEAKAYPVRILNWHELVNDFVGDRAILVSW